MDGGFNVDVTTPDAAATKDQQTQALTRQRRRTARKVRHAWVRGVLDGILSQLRPGDVAVDCGAGIGQVAGPIAETGATLYAFEPNPTAFAKLSERLALYPNAHAIQAAVSDKSGTTLLTDDAQTDTAFEAQVHDLTDILRDMVAGRVPRALPPRKGIRRRPGRVALLKLDIGGEELNLLPALHDADLLSPVGCTLVETHQRNFRDLRRDFLQMRRDIGGLYSARKVNLDWT